MCYKILAYTPVEYASELINNPKIDVYASKPNEIVVNMETNSIQFAHIHISQKLLRDYMAICTMPNKAMLNIEFPVGKIVATNTLPYF